LSCGAPRSVLTSADEEASAPHSGRSESWAGLCGVSKMKTDARCGEISGRGCPAPGCGRLDSPETCFYGAAVAGSFIRRSRLEVLACPHGCQDQACSETFRWRAALVGMGCRTGILRPDSRDHLQAAISTAWSRPIDPPAAARLSLGQAGEFTKCLLSGDFVLLHRNRRRSPLSGHVAFSPGLLPTMRVPAIGNPGRDGSMRIPDAAMRHG